MKRYSLIILILVLAVTFTTASDQKKSKANKKTENVVEEKSTLDKLRDRATQGDAEAMLLLGKAYYAGSDGAKQNFKTAAEWFLNAAEIDTPEAKPYSTEAKGWLGLLYYNGLGSGDGVEQDLDRAMKLFLIATRDGLEGMVETFDEMAKEGDVFACKFMTECYDKGVGVKRNTDKAAEYQRLAADAGDEDSYFPVGLYLYNNGKRGEAFKYFEKAALKSDIRASYFYGLMLYDGKDGVRQDKTKGLEYLQMAADQGHVAATYKLGDIYLNGNSQQDKKKGYQMIKFAAEKGNNNAMWTLANCYRLGNGAPQNYALAAQWMALVASANKATEYSNLIADLKSKNDPFYSYLKGLYEYNITGNTKAAMSLFQAVEKAQIAEGTTMQGVALIKKRDMKKAAKMLEKASSGSPLACYYLALLLENGDGVKQDSKTALNMLTVAANGGCAAAQCRLGDKYVKGSGVEIDVDKAANYYLLAEAQRALTPESAKQLATLYEKGIVKLPESEDLNKHVDKLRRTKENNTLINMLAGTKF
ncbi:MAG: sel1 repeat family protein [Muribaculaceae bacterium]|nr:sel1 repeat family protein [Muribaculaceae bacterium]